MFSLNAAVPDEVIVGPAVSTVMLNVSVADSPPASLAVMSRVC